MSQHKMRSIREVSAADILPYIQQNLRGPFQEVLALCIGATPTQKRLIEFADEYPDRWAAMMGQLAKLAGYSEKIEHNHQHAHLHAIGQLSDSQLAAMFEQISSSSTDPNIMAKLMSGIQQAGPLLLAAPDAAPKLAARGQRIASRIIKIRHRGRLL